MPISTWFNDPDDIALLNILPVRLSRLLAYECALKNLDQILVPDQTFFSPLS